MPDRAPMPSLMLPVQYNRLRRSPSDDETVDDPRELRKQKYKAKLNGHLESLKTLHTKTVDRFEETRRYAQEQVSKFHSKFHPIVSQSSEFVQGFLKNFEKPVAPRERRSVADTSYAQPMTPTLKVVEHESPCCPVIKDLKENTEYRSRVAQPDVIQYMPEVAVNAEDEIAQKRCPQCNAIVSDSVCTACLAAQQPAQSQFFRYVNGEPVPFVPRSTQSSPKRSAPSDFFVYDRFGHRYEENNGNLRLIAPEPTEFEADPETAQPNIAAFADIMNANADVVRDLNPFQDGRMISPVTDLAADAIDVVHDIARREVPESAVNATEPPKRSQDYRRSHYQIIPIRHDNRSGSLISKLHSKNDDSKANDRRQMSAHKWTVDRKNEDGISPSLKKIKHNKKEYEILTIGTHQSEDSAEEFDRIMKYLHSGRI